MKKVIFTGGGSGGHIFPIVAIARELRKIATMTEIYYLGPKENLDISILKKEGLKVKIIRAGKVRRYITFTSIPQNIFDLSFKTPSGFLQSYFFLLHNKPLFVFSKGGYGSLPVVYAAHFLKIPIFLHESDAIIGKANEISARFASRIFISFPLKDGFLAKNPEINDKIVLVGNPIRESILNGNKERAMRKFNLTFNKPVILILGGSQGAQRIRAIILEVLSSLLKNFEVIHQCGNKNISEIKSIAQVIIEKELLKYYHPFGFLNEEDLADAYQAAHLIVSRAGSGSIFEIAAVGKPSILIPLKESAQDHQRINASIYQKAGATLVIDEANFTPHFFLEKLHYLFSNPETMKIMAKKAQAFAKVDAAQKIARFLKQYL